MNLHLTYFEANFVIFCYLFCKACVHITSRKLLIYEVVLDYDDTGANPKHDPRGRRGGRGKYP